MSIDNISIEELTQQRCQACEGGVKPLDNEQSNKYLNKINNSDNNFAAKWELSDSGLEIYCDFSFKNYYHTMAFVNAIAFMAHDEGHHPDLEVGYNHCKVNYTTHAINGLSENDFICAAKVAQLYGQSPSNKARKK